MASTQIGKIAVTAGGTWNATTAYPVITVVTSADGKSSYISKKDVPAGTALSNTEYWQKIVEGAPPTQEQVNAWLDAHPEATTTVQNHSLSYEKLINGTLGFVTPEMFGATGDGESDDRSALNDMLEFACEFGCAVIFAPKTYIIKPTAGDETAILLPITRGISIHGNGATIKIEDDTPGFGAIIGSGSDDLSGLTISGLTFDHNSANAKNFSVGSRYGADVLDSARQTVYIKSCSAFDFVGNTVKHAACTNSITYSGDGNTSNCRIAGNRFLSMGRTPNRIYHDHSTIYATGDGILIEGNMFEGESWGVEGTTCAIEVHPGNGCIIRGNRGTKYQSAINYAGVYETDSAHGIISDNAFETLRHGIVMFGTTYLTHVDGYSIDGLLIDGNQFRIHNAISSGYMSGGVAGVGGIVFNASLSLPVRNVTVCNNLLVYDIEDEVPDYAAQYGALGIRESAANTVYENVVFRDCTLINPPLYCVSMGDNRGTLKNCKAVRIRCVNPCASKLPNASWNYAYRRGINVRPNSVDGTLEIDVEFVGAYKEKLVRPIVHTVNTSGGAVNYKCRIEWLTIPTDWSDYKLCVTYGDAVVPKLQIVVNDGSIQTLGDFAPSFTTIRAKAGSSIYKKSAGKMYVYTAEGTASTELTPASASDFALIGLLD